MGGVRYQLGGTRTDRSWGRGGNRSALGPDTKRRRAPGPDTQKERRAPTESAGPRHKERRVPTDKRRTPTQRAPGPDTQGLDRQTVSARPNTDRRYLENEALGVDPGPDARSAWPRHKERPERRAPTQTKPEEDRRAPTQTATESRSSGPFHDSLRRAALGLDADPRHKAPGSDKKIAGPRHRSRHKQRAPGEDRRSPTLRRRAGPRHSEGAPGPGHDTKRLAPTQRGPRDSEGAPGPDTKRRAPTQGAPGPDTKSAGPRHSEDAQGPDTQSARRAPTQRVPGAPTLRRRAGPRHKRRAPTQRAPGPDTKKERRAPTQSAGPQQPLA